MTSNDTGVTSGQRSGTGQSTRRTFLGGLGATAGIGVWNGRDLEEYAPDPGGEAGIEIEYEETHVRRETAGPLARSYAIAISGNQVDNCPVGVLARTVPADSDNEAARGTERPYSFTVTGNVISDAADAEIRIRSGDAGVVATNAVRNGPAPIEIDNTYDAAIQQGLNATRAIAENPHGSQRRFSTSDRRSPGDVAMGVRRAGSPRGPPGEPTAVPAAAPGSECPLERCEEQRADGQERKRTRVANGIACDSRRVGRARREPISQPADQRRADGFGTVRPRALGAGRGPERRVQ